MNSMRVVLSAALAALVVAPPSVGADAMPINCWTCSGPGSGWPGECVSVSGYGNKSCFVSTGVCYLYGAECHLTSLDQYSLEGTVLAEASDSDRSPLDSDATYYERDCSGQVRDRQYGAVKAAAAADATSSIEL